LWIGPGVSYDRQSREKLIAAEADGSNTTHCRAWSIDPLTSGKSRRTLTYLQHRSV